MTTSDARTSALVRPPVPMSRVYLFALIELAAVGALATPIVVSLSLKVLEVVPEDQKESAFGLVTSIGALAALVANPVFGHLSDRTRSRFGRRRPWMVAGVIVGAAAALLLALAPNLPTVIAAWALSQAAYNATLAALSSLLADQLPEDQRAKASGVFGAFGFLGLVPAMVVAALFSSQLTVLILAMPILAVVLVLLICLLIPDPPVSSPRARHGSLVAVFAAFAFNPFKVPMFTLVWIQRAVMQFGYTIVSAFGLYYLMLRLSLDQSAAAALTSTATLAGAALNFVAAMGFGYAASRRGNYTAVVVGTALLMSASLLLKAFTGDLVSFWVSTLLAGFALGAYYAVDLAVVMRTLPPGHEGKYLGIFNMAKTLPQSLAPAVAPFVLLIGGDDPIAGGDRNYAALFGVAGLLVLASLLVVPRLGRVLRRDRYEESLGGAGAPTAVTVPAPEVR